MIATSNSNLFQFKQVVGFIAINFEMKSGVETNPSTLIANDDKPLSGNGFIDLSANEPIFVLDGTDAKPEATHYLKGGYTTDDTENDHGVEIFPIPVGTYEKGFTLTMQVFDPETETWIEMEKATTKSITVGRGEYVNFTAFDGYELMVETRDAYLKHLEEIKEMVEGQKTTLKTIWDSLLGNSDGQHGPYPDSWEDENNLNSWEYVGVDREGWVTSLNIYGRQMNGHIPAAIGELTHLNTLMLQGLGITDTVPEEIGSLTELERLWIQNNQLEGSLPSTIYNLPKMRSLGIANNYFNFAITKQMQQNSVMWQNLDLRNSYINPQRGREENGVWKQYHVDVEGAVSSITLNSTDVTLGLGEEFQLSIVGHEPADANISNVEWTSWTRVGEYSYSNNDNVISISENGLISVNGYGEAMVRVRILDGGGQEVWVNIHVLDAEQVAYQNELKDILMEFYTATGGPAWYNQNNWATDAPITSWGGLTFDNGKLTRIELRHNNLKGTIPDSFWNITSLTFLKLESNELSGAFPAKIVNLTNLDHINLCGNKFTGTISGVLEILSSLTKLRYLDIQDNPFTGTVSDAIEGIKKFPNMESVNLGHTNLTGTLASIGELSILPRLESLDLYNNQITDTIPSDVGNLTNLRHLHLGGNRLTGSIPKEIANLTNLEDLYLAFNDLTGTIPENLKVLNLREFNVSYNHLTIPSPLPEWLDSWLQTIENCSIDYQTSAYNSSTEGFNGNDKSW